MLDVIAMIGVLSNCLIKWHAETPSKLGMMISISTKSYFDPAFILFTASKPSSCAYQYIMATKWGAELTALSIEQWNAYRNLLPMRLHVGSSSTKRI